MRQSLSDPTERAYYLTHASKATPLRKLVEIAGSRWAIEECFQQANGQTGLDEYEVRSWQGWHRHITLSMFAHALLAVLRCEANRLSTSNNTPKKWRHVDLIPLTVPEVHLLLTAVC